MALKIATRGLAVVLGAAVALPASNVAADFDKPKPAIDCTKRKNRTKPACQPRRAQATQDEIFNSAYWMNRSGRYGEALDILKLAKDQNDPRVLNETGYATRKLGDVASALTFYRRALAINPDYVFARAYMGEALLIQGYVTAAGNQLREIEKRCGTNCTAYVHLAKSIAETSPGHPTGG